MRKVKEFYQLCFAVALQQVESVMKLHMYEAFQMTGEGVRLASKREEGHG